MDILEWYKEEYNEPNEEKVKEILYNKWQQARNETLRLLTDKDYADEQRKNYGKLIVKLLQEAIDEAKAEKQQKQGLKKRRKKHV